MAAAVRSWAEQGEQDGFAVLPGGFSAGQTDAILRELSAALTRASESGPAILGHAGAVYAARNVLTFWPAAAEVWCRRPLHGALAEILGPAFGLVRVLFFDKPPEQSWAL